MNARFEIEIMELLRGGQKAAPFFLVSCSLDYT